MAELGNERQPLLTILGEYAKVVRDLEVGNSIRKVARIHAISTITACYGCDGYSFTVKYMA